ncbi:hypothetical protein SUGI_0424130 [Cryptomeria japonica]|uniref:expansin-A4 n=1 Tax=Cryptomeria japonica TaxID=3369 RepID=UPI002408A025|nr:expansin-A4 [Cryptomeria japonica]GLJ22529.1 hypothetical protein SUGI_0424130 [Cryptomeria japonica]
MDCRLRIILCFVILTWLKQGACYKQKGTYNGWSYAYATPNAPADDSDTIAGACGYGNVQRRSYGSNTAAVSTALFNNGLTCGACFQIRCVDDPQWCLTGSPSVVITTTNFCPPNYALPGDNGGWCNPPRHHFEIAPLAFERIAFWKAGIVPIQYKRVKCQREGGLHFTIEGTYFFFLVVVTNVGSAGDVVGVSVKGSRTGGWVAMSRNWGQIWHSNINLIGQSLSFEVTTSDGRRLTSYAVAPPQWQFGQTFQGRQFL